MRALWGKGFSLKPADSDPGMSPNYLDGNEIYLSDTMPVQVTSLYYRAAATHASLHHIYGCHHFKKSDLNLMQRSMVGLMEDLRVELLAIRKFPGLRRLWADMHDVRPGLPDNAQNLMRRLSLSVLDPDYEDDHLWVMNGKQLVLGDIENLGDPGLALRAGLQLANELGQMRLPLNTGRYEQPVTYRDDNRCLWRDDIEYPQQGDVANAALDSQISHSKLIEAADGVNIKLAVASAQTAAGFFISPDAGLELEYSQQEIIQPVSLKLYPEWDYRTHVLKRNWCTVVESQYMSGSMEKVMAVFELHKVVLSRLRHVALKLRTEKMRRIRKLESGDEPDIDPMINALVALRSNRTPDMRVFMQNRYWQSRNLAISILLDLSESTNEVIASAGVSISILIRDAVLLLGETLSIAGEKFSISGFSSNSRHQVNINIFKKFNEPFDASKARLSNVNGMHSTRLGTAIRHCGHHLAQQSEMHKLLLVITDGAPSDIDVYDRHYLEHESKHAVQALKASGIKTFGINLDSSADPVIEHIFGKGRFETLDRLERLPEVLSYIYLRHLRH